MPVGCPGLTRTEQLRQARTQAALQQQAQREMARQQPEPMIRRPRRTPRPEPKKIDFTKPGLTKAMIAKLKHSEKFKQELERKAEATIHGRVPRRTPAPVGGDARMGRERMPRARRTPGPSRASSPGPSQVARATTPRSPVPKKTAELARIMNADVIQAEPVGSGPVENIVIPSGLVSDRPTIVNITPPVEPVPEARVGMDIASQSIQVINQSLDQQDAAEAAAVQNRLADLQQARRDFVIAVANVGGNAVNLEDAQPAEDIYEEPPGSPLRPTSPIFPPSPPVYLQRIPVVEEPPGFDHPDVVAAMEHLKKIREEMRAREVHRRLEEEFARIQAETDAANIPLGVDGLPLTEPDPYHYPPFDPEDLERFFDVQRYPPSPCGHCGGPPTGREALPADLWELDDPWARPPPEPDVPDMIQFD